MQPDQVSQEALEEACDQACILDFIRGLKDGFETEIGMKGAALSGGQRQVRPRFIQPIVDALLTHPTLLRLIASLYRPCTDQEARDLVFGW